LLGVVSKVEEQNHAFRCDKKLAWGKNVKCQQGCIYKLMIALFSICTKMVYINNRMICYHKVINRPLNKKQCNLKIERERKKK